MSRLFWVRHGPTHEAAMTGWRDVPADLSDEAALDRLAAALPAEAPVVASDLSRAVATADALARGRPRLPDRAGLREFDFGEWDGRHATDIARSHPDLSRAYWERPGDIAPPGGESWNQAAARVAAAVASLRAAHRGDLVLVAHFGVILTQYAAAARLDPHAALAQRIDALSLTIVGPDGVEAVNHRP